MELLIQPKDKAQFQSTKEALADLPFMLFPSSFCCMDQGKSKPHGKNEEMWPVPGAWRLGGSYCTNLGSSKVSLMGLSETF